MWVNPAPYGTGRSIALASSAGLPAASLTTGDRFTAFRRAVGALGCARCGFLNFGIESMY